MIGRTGLAGTGLLRDGIAAALADRMVPVTAGQDPPELAALVVASDAWEIPEVHPVRRLAWERSVPWLPVRTELGHAVIGPLEIPREAGCADCAATRRRQAQETPDRYEEVRRLHGALLAGRPSSWLTGLAADLIGVLVAGEVDRSPTGAPPRTRRALLRIDLEQLTIARHRYLPDPHCDTCGSPVDDSPERARAGSGPVPGGWVMPRGVPAPPRPGARRSR